MATKKVTEKEVRFATSLLRYLGAGTENTYLLLAVIAWTRSRSAQHIFGTSPLVLANFLKKTKGGGYEYIVRAARHGADTNEERVTQARDFLTAVAMSQWSADHYGSADGDMTTNKLLTVWAGLTGKSIPKAWLAPKPPPPPKPVKPRLVQPVGSTPTGTSDHIRHEYLDPFATRSFYDGRPHNGDFVLPGDVLGDVPE